MTNAAGAAGNNGTNPRDILGNFGQAINDPWIHQHSNGFLNATVSNTDCYRSGGGCRFARQRRTSKTTRCEFASGPTDNDGFGVVVRAQDDNNFYRINCSNERSVAIGTTRPPRGMSVQKVQNGVWSELYRDDQNRNSLYCRQMAQPPKHQRLLAIPVFDLSVKAVGNSLRVSVRDQGGNIINYPLITGWYQPVLDRHGRASPPGATKTCTT